MSGSREGARGSVLLVKERGPVRRLVQKVLEEAGYGVVSLHDAHASLSLLRAEGDRFDVLVLDTATTEMSAEQLAEEVRRLDPRCRIVLVARDSGSRLASGEAFGVRYVDQPVKLSQLYDAVEMSIAEIAAGPDEDGPGPFDPAHGA